MSNVLFLLAIPYGVAIAAVVVMVAAFLVERD